MKYKRKAVGNAHLSFCHARVSGVLLLFLAQILAWSQEPLGAPARAGSPAPSSQAFGAQIRDLVRHSNRLHLEVLPEVEGYLVVSVSAGETTAVIPDKPRLLLHLGLNPGDGRAAQAVHDFLRDVAEGKAKHLTDKTRLLVLLAQPAVSPVEQVGPAPVGRRAFALLPILKHWKPDLFVDLGYRFGLDPRPGLSLGFIGPHGHSPRASDWLRETLLARGTPGSVRRWAVWGYSGRARGGQRFEGGLKNLVDAASYDCRVTVT